MAQANPWTEASCHRLYYRPQEDSQTYFLLEITGKLTTDGTVLSPFPLRLSGPHDSSPLGNIGNSFGLQYHHVSTAREPQGIKSHPLFTTNTTRPTASGPIIPSRHSRRHKLPTLRMNYISRRIGKRNFPELPPTDYLQLANTAYAY